MTLALALAAALTGCGESFDPPETYPHTDIEDGYAHGVGKSVPYLCHDPVSGGVITCPSDGRPEARGVSCDAAGCHGDTEYVGEAPEERHLLGSDGPSCWTCHDREWSNRTEVSP